MKPDLNTHPSGEEEKMVTGKQKAHDTEHASKKAKSENEGQGHANEKSRADITADFDKFCKATGRTSQLNKCAKYWMPIAKTQEGSDDAVVPRCQDMLFDGALDKCPVCGSHLKFGRTKYICPGAYSDGSTCTFSSRDSQRKEGAITFPGFVEEIPIFDVMMLHILIYSILPYMFMNIKYLS